MNNLATIVPVPSKQSVPIEPQAIRERVRDQIRECKLLARILIRAPEALVQWLMIMFRASMPLINLLLASK
jgi:hypothetical protein